MPVICSIITDEPTTVACGAVGAEINGYGKVPRLRADVLSKSTPHAFVIGIDVNVLTDSQISVPSENLKYLPLEFSPYSIKLFKLLFKEIHK